MINTRFVRASDCDARKGAVDIKGISFIFRLAVSNIDPNMIFRSVLLCHFLCGLPDNMCVDGLEEEDQDVREEREDE